jgi:hypothetical protein
MPPHMPDNNVLPVEHGDDIRLVCDYLIMRVYMSLWIVLRSAVLAVPTPSSGM